MLALLLALSSLRAEAHAHGLPVSLVVEVARTESGLRLGAVSRSGAVGLMQIAPGWTRAGRLCAGLDLMDAQQNARCGCRLLVRGLRDCGWPAGLGWYHGGRCSIDGYARGIIRRLGGVTT